MLAYAISKLSLAMLSVSRQRASSHIIWSVVESPTRVLHKEIHSSAAFNNLNKRSEATERDEEGHNFSCHVKILSQMANKKSLIKYYIMCQ